MKIKYVVELLIELGIPGKEKQRAIKEAVENRAFKNTRAYVKRAVEKYVEKTLIRWAYTDEVIAKPIRLRDKHGKYVKGRGKQSNWPDTVVEEAAAVGAVKEAWRKKHGLKKGLSKERIKVIKRAASVLDERPFAVYTPPPLVGPLSKQHITPKQIKMRFVSENYEGIDLFPGKNNEEKVDCVSELVEGWVAAIEKVRQWKYDGINAQIMKKYGKLKHRIPAEIDFSQFDPWRIKIPCPWRIDRPARVELYWWSRPSKNGREFYRWPFRWQRTLSESTRDQIVLYENGIDPREFLKIDVGDREGWARAELEKIEHELEQRERTLLRLGIEKTSFSAFLAMEESAPETLTAKDTQILKTAQERLRLEWRLAGLKNWFQV